MNTENLYWVLSPEAYTALRENLKREAERERREAIQNFGFAAPRPQAPRVRRPWFNRLARLTPQKA
jgi:hypothetical protein